MKITLEIEILDEDYAPAFGKLNAGHVQNALARAFPFSRLSAYEVRDIDPRPAEQALRILRAIDAEGRSFAAVSRAGGGWTVSMVHTEHRGADLTDALAQFAQTLMADGWSE